MRRVHVVGLVLSLCAMVAWGAADAPARNREPELILNAGMPEDLRGVVRTTWERFTTVFRARASCFGPVTVSGAWDLGDRGVYDPARSEVTVRIPGTAPNLEATLAHEFAHHLESTCGAQSEMRPRFMAAQGFAPGAEWFEGPTWEATPSEQFAEAVSIFVLGRRPAHVRMSVSRQAIRVVGEWALGR